METLSFVFHMPLACFGIAFPALMLFVEALWLRTDDPVYRELARRWSKVVVVLFSVGVASGTILPFEMGLLWRTSWRRSIRQIADRLGRITLPMLTGVLRLRRL